MAQNPLRRITGGPLVNASPIRVSSFCASSICAITFGAAFFFAANLAAPSFTRASFENSDWGVRAVGMGGAFAAISDDGSAPFWNPAGSAFLDRPQGSFMWERAYPGLTEVDIRSGFLSFIAPSRLGSVGGALTSYSFGNLLTENTALLHYSRKFGRLGAGANAKYLTHDYKIGSDPAFASNPVFANGTVSGNVTADIGVLLRLGRKVSVGVAARNLTEPDVGLRSADKVPAEFQAGIALKRTRRTTFELDYAYKNLAEGASQSKSKILLGGEYLFLKSNRFDLTVRAGTSRDLSSDQKKALQNAAAGFSVSTDIQNWLTLNLDYAFLININLADSYSQVSQAGSHKIGMSLLFGGPKASPPLIGPLNRPN